jgi:hypothetical protein
VEDVCKEILSSRRLGHWRTEREVLQLREWRSGEKAESRPSEEDRWREIERSHELGSSQGESPNIGYSESRGREAREGG